MFQNTIPAQSTHLPAGGPVQASSSQLEKYPDVITYSDPGLNPSSGVTLLFTCAMELSAMIKQEESSEVAIVNQSISDDSVGGKSSLGKPGMPCWPA